MLAGVGKSTRDIAGFRERGGERDFDMKRGGQRRDEPDGVFSGFVANDVSLESESDQLNPPCVAGCNGAEIKAN